MAEKSLQDFKVLPVKFHKGTQIGHELFIKKHVVRTDSVDKPIGKTLFVLNIPPYATVNSLKQVFKKAGNVSNVILQDTPTGNDEVTDSGSNFFKTHKALCGFKVGYIIFDRPRGLIDALQLNSLQPLNTKEQPIECGIKKWAHNYNRSIPDLVDLESEINTFIETFDKEEQKRLLDEKQENEDDKGWITVTKRGRHPGLARKESVANRIRQKDAKSKKKKELLNFYTFQIRETKIKHLANLRQKFEEDKKKITLLKQSRRFKPF